MGSAPMWVIWAVPDPFQGEGLQCRLLQGLQLPSAPLTGYLNGCVVYVDATNDQQYTSLQDPASFTSVSGSWSINMMNFQKQYNLFIQPSNVFVVGLQEVVLMLRVEMFIEI